jgi:hypothetical protein
MQAQVGDQVCLLPVYHFCWNLQELAPLLPPFPCTFLCHLHALHMMNDYHQSSWRTRCMHRQRVLCSLPQPWHRGTHSRLPVSANGQTRNSLRPVTVTVTVTEMPMAVPFCIKTDWDTRLGRAAAYYVISYLFRISYTCACTFSYLFGYLSARFGPCMMTGGKRKN